MEKYTRLILFLVCLTLPVSANAFPDKRVTIQPIQILYGTNSKTNPNGILFEAEMDKIWAQAGIDIEFLAFNQWSSSGDFSVGLDELMPRFNTFGNYIGPPQFFTNAGGKNADPLVINMWFVGEIYFGIGDTILGVSNTGWPPVDIYGNLPPANGIAISDIIFGDIPNSDGVMAFDVIAHEIGHTLGLYHSDDPYGLFGNSYENPNNLMSTFWYDSGSSIDDIPPDGSYNLLNTTQINKARLSPFARNIATVPEPYSIILIGFGLSALAGIKRKFNK